MAHGITSVGFHIIGLRIHHMESSRSWLEQPIRGYSIVLCGVYMTVIPLRTRSDYASSAKAPCNQGDAPLT